ncbi:MAG: hypothetical protein LBV12_09920 [Puniceicoccales bacterium]|jgi:hypothetical protein|nr:hypothetical protein [Puniceicoccales bacterium]
MISFSKQISQSIAASSLVVASLLMVGCSTTNDRTKGKSDICPVHHVQMEKETYKLGRKNPTPESLEQWSAAQKIAAQQFPYPGSQAEPLSGPNIPWDYETLYRCPQCAAAYQKWAEENPQEKFSSKRSSRN